ncbi:MAG: ABC transporter ATP-binding protein [Actinomycetota bacterium]|nr:ABC transporter ATP-binding protein [Actinomycetota bacterium]MDP2289210.1 ABC transporter ATP-binding protein [Actinomycetota bacterium]
MDLELRGIRKEFPGVLANDDVSLVARSGKVLALIGENGAGKSTLMNVLSGIYRPDAGEILLDGVAQSFHDPGAAIAAGIGMVHQHFMLVQIFSVADNVVLGVEPTTFGGVMDRKRARTEVREISQRYGLAVDPDAIIESLPVGIQQRVEIIKILLRGAKVIVFDEPTAVLTPQEVEEFFSIVAELKSNGAAIIFITHKLKEALAIADDITVLRAGKVAGHADPKTATPEELAALMVGRDIDLSVDKAPAKPGATVLELNDVTVTDDYGRKLLDSISMTVAGGEIVGIAGIQGNGQTELVQAITGLQQIETGKVIFEGRDVTKLSPRKLHQAGIAHVPEDRNHMGMVGSFSLSENLILDSYYSDAFSRGMQLHRDAIQDSAVALVKAYDVRPPNIDNTGDALSGGNAQKMIVAREFSRDVPLVICAQPTRGIDVGSIEYIHEQIVRKRDEGKAILIVSTELDEIFSLADRILVMYDGEIVAERVTSETTPTEIGLFMAGNHA